MASPLRIVFAGAEEAEPLMRRALSIDEASYGEEPPDVATRLKTLLHCFGRRTVWRKRSHYRGAMSKSSFHLEKRQGMNIRICRLRWVTTFCCYKKMGMTEQEAIEKIQSKLQSLS